MSFVEEICNGPSPAVDCQLSSWSEWSHCTTDCGVGGLQTRTRQRTIYERCGGSCSGGSDLKMERSCPRKTCFNGGSLMGGACSCKEGYTGYCCEKSNYRTYREKRNRITYFFRAPYMVLVVGRISTLTSLSYKQRGMAAKLI